MTEHTPLDNILNDEPTEAPASDEPTQETAEQTTQEQPEQEAATDGPPRDERGRFAPKGEQEETPAAAPPAAQQEEERIPVAALKDERSKRQALESELERLKAQFAQFQQPQVQQQPQAEQGPPDRWEDPEGYDQWLIQRATAAAQEQAIHAYQQQRIHTSAVRARAKYADYDQAHQVFGEMVQRNPALFDQLMSADDPAEYAYNQAKAEIGIRSAGGLQAYIQQEAARLAAEQAAQQQQSLENVANRLPPSAPPTISDSRNTGSRSGPEWAGPKDLGDILR